MWPVYLGITVCIYASVEATCKIVNTHRLLPGDNINNAMYLPMNTFLICGYFWDQKFFEVKISYSLNSYGTSNQVGNGVYSIKHAYIMAECKTTKHQSNSFYKLTRT